jgi:hypothetical protein
VIPLIEMSSRGAATQQSQRVYHGPFLAETSILSLLPVEISCKRNTAACPTNFPVLYCLTLLGREVVACPSDDQHSIDCHWCVRLSIPKLQYVKSSDLATR